MKRKYYFKIMPQYNDGSYSLDKYRVWTPIAVIAENIKGAKTKLLDCADNFLYKSFNKKWELVDLEKRQPRMFGEVKRIEWELLKIEEVQSSLTK